MAASLPNYDLHTILGSGPNNCRVQLVNPDGGPIGDQGERTVGWMLASGENLGALAPGYRNEPAVPATFDVHCSSILSAGN